MGPSKLLKTLIIFFTFISSLQSEALKRRFQCYNCKTEESGLNCLYSPENMTEPRSRVFCRHYCIIRRVEFVYIPESTIALHRACEEKPEVLDGVVAGDHFLTYFRSCRSHLCNSGDGTTSYSIPGDNSTEETIYYDEDQASRREILPLFLIISLIVIKVIC